MRAGRSGPGLTEGGGGSKLDAAEAVGHPDAAGRPERRPSRRASRGADPPIHPSETARSACFPCVKSPPAVHTLPVVDAGSRLRPVRRPGVP